jgi:hypothetical protein
MLILRAALRRRPQMRLDEFDCAPEDLLGVGAAIEADERSELAAAARVN